MARQLFKKTTFAVEEPVVNLTPLIDVVFVILIMFILIAPMLEMENVQLADASSNAKDMKPLARESGPIVIHVSADNTVLFNKIPVSIDRLGDALKEVKKLHPKAVPQLFHDKKASFGTYQSVKNAAEAAGFDELDLFLDPNKFKS